MTAVAPDLSWNFLSPEVPGAWNSADGQAEWDANFVLRTTATTALGSKTITIADVVGVEPGMAISGATIPSGTTITGLASSTATTSNAATATGSGEPCSIALRTPSVIPAAMTVAPGSGVNLGVAATGGYMAPGEWSGTFTAGSFVITDVASTTGIFAGEQLENLAGLDVDFLPNGVVNTITAVTSSTITFTNTPGGPSQGVPVPALATGTGIAFTVLDQWPLGSLQVSVTPSTGVTVTDTNADGTGNVDNAGSGTSIVNYSGQAEGSFRVMFATTGSFSISVAYVPADAHYAAATIAVPFTVVVA